MIHAQTEDGGAGDAGIDGRSVRAILPNLALAFLLAPFAGCVTAGLLAAILAAPYCFSIGRWRDQEAGYSLSGSLSSAIGIAAITAMASLLVAAFCTAVGGTLVARRHARGRRVSPAALIVSAVVAAIVPTAAFPLLLGIPTEFTRRDGPGANWVLTFFFSVAIATAIATSWTFWWLGLRGRPAPSP